MKKRLEKRFQQEINRKNEARSVENLPISMQENRLSNGYIAAYACGPLTRQRYINERMEIELANFKIEVKKRFENSQITTWKFPRKPNDSPEREATFERGNYNLKDQKMIDQWNTIDNYYKKRMKYKTNKPHIQVPSQGESGNNYTEPTIDISEPPELRNSHNMSTRAKIPEKIKFQEKTIKFDFSKLREEKFHDFYHKNNKSVETTRIHKDSSRNKTQKLNLFNNPSNRSRSGKKRSQIQTNYIKSLIKSNTELQEANKPKKFYATIAQSYERASSKSGRSNRRANLNRKKYEKRSNKSKEFIAEAKRLDSIRTNNLNMLKNKYNMSRNIQDKIYRSGTGEISLHHLASINKPPISDGRNTDDYIRATTRRKKSSNKKSEKKSMLFNIIPSYTISMDSSNKSNINCYDKNVVGKFDIQKTYNISTNASNRNNLTLTDKISTSRYKSHRKANKSTAIGDKKTQFIPPKGDSTKRSFSGNKHNPVFALGITRRKKKK
ncbi:unnamed protein product [Moneuplotes crassus]|uniref:Uncharacterized protein n=1 Tax=Euplotes crassus TaxID=5936 RepID=A0AAD1U2A8_EUPCR|nr:unnamed protein product [Moneuplotes crassus]